MQLKNNFSLEVRLLYLYEFSCCLCGSNGNGRGGLELHHILGRISDSAFNSALVCNGCHSTMGHSREEHQRVFSKSFPVLHRLGFKPQDDDIEFLKDNFDELGVVHTYKNCLV